MHIQYFGDSFDIIKQSLLNWLNECGEWSVHPMFTEAASSTDARAFSRFLDATLVTSEVLTTNTDRTKYFSSPAHIVNLFLDPDTGIKVFKSGKKPEYIYGLELVEIVKARPHSLTMVFDKSVARGSESKDAGQKLKYFRKQGIFGFAYVAQTCFIVLSSDSKLAGRAYKTVLKKSKLPKRRLLGKVSA